MGHAADAIARSGDKSKRISEADRPDPVGSLAATFNHMLEALETSFNLINLKDAAVPSAPARSG